MKFKESMESEYQEGYNKNLDPYGHCVYMFAEKWADYLEKEIESNSNRPVEMVIFEKASSCANKADDECGGITGFMYGCAVNILSHCWIHGDILRRWHNKEYNYEGDGVVNPALISIKVRE